MSPTFRLMGPSAGWKRFATAPFKCQLQHLSMRTSKTSPVLNSVSYSADVSERNSCRFWFSILVLTPANTVERPTQTITYQRLISPTSSVEYDVSFSATQPVSRLNWLTFTRVGT